MKTASTGILGLGQPYECKHDWPEDCKVQAGSRGIVLSKSKGNYRTAFFEAFPNNPDTFIRGEGLTIEDAETAAWNKLLTYQACVGHEFERRNYTNGVGFCKHCGLFKPHAFDPLTRCIICDSPTDYGYDKKGRYYCKDHIDKIPQEDLPEWKKLLDELDKTD